MSGIGSIKKGKLKLIKMKTSLNEDVEFKDIDINPLIKDFMIREAFNMFDEDHSGEIDKREFSKLITSLGLELNEKRINELMKEMDKDGSGTIDFDEFSAMMSSFQFGKESQIQQHLESAFNDYDKDMDTFILPEDFKKVSEELDSIPISKEDAEMFITFCKHFGREKGIKSINDNAVSKEEFINTLLQLNFLIENKGETKSKYSTNAQNTNTNNTVSNLNQSQAVESYINPSERQPSSLNKRQQSQGNKSESNVNESKESSSLFDN